MKKLALTALFALLSACPMPGNDPATTPASQGSTQDPSTEACLQPISLVRPGPEVQQWTGELPANPPQRSAYVVMPINEERTEFLLVLTYPDKKEILSSFYLPSVKDKIAAVNQINAQIINYPQILLAVLGGLRPLPQPGPPGEPGRAYHLALNVGNSLVWNETNLPLNLDQLPPGKVDSPTHGN